MSTKTVTPEQIRSAVLDFIRKDECTKNITNLGLAQMLVNKFGCSLPIAGKLVLSDLWNASELANRACQHLRKKGLIQYDPKQKWTLTSTK